MTKFSESTVEDAALSWLDPLGYSIAHGPEIAPDCLTAERSEFSDVFLNDRQKASKTTVPPCSPPSNFTSRFPACRVGFSD